MRDEGGLVKGLVKVEIAFFADIGGDACVDACGNLYLNQYFHSRQIKPYSLNSTIPATSCDDINAAFASRVFER